MTEIETLKELEKKLNRELINPVYGGPLPLELFHYTSAGGLHGILQSRSIRLTNSAYVNDEGELTYPVELARRVLRQVRAKIMDDRLSRVIDDAADGLTFHVSFKPWFVASFSTDPNSLSQWRAYCPNGGYSLGFATRTLIGGGAVLGPVEYDEDKQIAIVTTMVDEFVAAWTLHFPAVEYLDDAAAMFVNQLVAALGTEFVYFKARAFADEHEWRISKVGEKTSPVQFYERRGLMTPWLEHTLAASGEPFPVSSLGISPLSDPELAHHSAALMLRQAGVENPDQIIKPSGFKLRP